jgi:hypothetical protein
MVSQAAAEFLRNYERDALARWSPGDLSAQQAFVNAQLVGLRWLDLSTPEAALQLLQASLAHPSAGGAEEFDAAVLGGPVVELMEPRTLFSRVALRLRRNGRLVGIVPCLRDNSPESRLFAELAEAILRPYYTAEELLEILRETGWQVDSCASGFTPIHRFNEAVFKDQLGFKGFNRIFTQLVSEGYDPMEVGWGELRFVGTPA